MYIPLTKPGNITDIPNLVLLVARPNIQKMIKMID
jgi:hypothetical protein